jgi:hypothetical protein
VPAGDRLYVGGNFDRVNGQPRNGFAVLDVTTGALLPETTAVSSGDYVLALALSDSALLAGGAKSGGG